MTVKNENMDPVILHIDGFWNSPYAFSAFVCLREKGLPFEWAEDVADETFRGLSILRVDVEEARRLREGDPAVQAGRYSVKAIPWTVPAGAMSFTPTRFPRSIAEASSGSVPE